MDRQFLEFFGNLCLSAAKGQQQMADTAKWIRQGLQGVGDLTELFQNIYGIEKSSKKSTTWENAALEFNKALNTWIGMMGGIPKQQYDDLKRKYAKLENKVASQEKTILQLRDLLDENGTSQAEAALGVAKMMEKQQQQFQTLMENMGEAFKVSQKDNKNSDKHD